MEDPEDYDNNQNNLIKNEDSIEYPKNLEKLNRWTIPSVPSKQIYKFGTFDILSRYAVKTVERTIQVTGNTKTIRLLSKEDLLPFKGYNFIHIGLIQIAFKPLTMLGLNSSIMAYVRDGRCKDFKPSLAALIETSLCHGPVYFDVSPNLSLSLTDKHLSDAMQLTIHTSGYNYKTGSEIIAICYRVYYRVLNTLNPKAKQISFPGTTTLVQTNLLTSNIATNRLIKWNEIDFPETWTLPQEVDPDPIINTDTDQITQTTEGDIEIRFTPQRSIKIPRSISSMPRTMSSRYSMSEFHTAPLELSRASTSQIREDIESVENIRISDNKIPQGIYQKNTSQSRESPTQSEMSFHL
jgi:hypothetical protein